MSRPKLLLAALVLLPLSACFGGAGTPSQLLSLTPQNSRPVSEVRAAEQGRVIGVISPTVPQAINTNRVPVYVDATTIQYLKGAQWVEKPNELFRTLVSETLSARTGWVVLDPSLFTQVQGLVLGGQLIRFGVDPVAMQVVVQFEATLARPEQAVSTNRFESRVPIATTDPREVATALNQAANAVAAQVADWVG